MSAQTEVTGTIPGRRAVRCARARLALDLVIGIAQVVILLAAFANWDHPARFGEYAGILALCVLWDIATEVRKLAARENPHA
jgi:hypothetical protein